MSASLAEFVVIRNQLGVYVLDTLNSGGGSGTQVVINPPAQNQLALSQVWWKGPDRALFRGLGFIDGPWNRVLLVEQGATILVVAPESDLNSAWAWESSDQHIWNLETKDILDLIGSNLEPNATVVPVASKYASSSSQWQVLPVGQYFQWQHDTTKYLGLSGGTLKSNTPLVVSADPQTLMNLWYPTDDGHIQHQLDASLVFDVVHGKAAAGTLVQIHTKNNPSTAGQQWYFDGAFLCCELQDSRGNDMVLDVQTTSTKDNIPEWECYLNSRDESSLTQQWAQVAPFTSIG